jgi:L-seryl-tRNA(Ser) seleniumtransferase
VSARPDFSRLPAIDRLVSDPLLSETRKRFGDTVVTATARETVEELRRLAAGGVDIPEPQDIAASVARSVESLMASNLTPVFNLTGTVIHTNLGRAPLAAEAVTAMQRAAGAAALEFDLADGKRGDRDSIVEDWLVRLTGAEAATVVNNNAAAVLLVLNSFATGKECIVSRGELIEIGGAFRMPDIMTRAGCHLREVGTTNRTHLKDFAEAAGPETGMMMKVHTSNYVVQGFTKQPAESEIAAIAHQHGVPFVNDLGSGMLVNLEDFGLPHEPTPAEAIADGADIVTFSGDKLLGGPQAGMIVGKRELIARIKKNPLKRALRLDKVTLAALEATLALYADPARLCERLPVMRLLTRSPDDIRQAAGHVAERLETCLGEGWIVDVIASRSQIGSGSLPVDLLESASVSIRPAGKPGSGGGKLNRLAEAFRNLPVPVIGRMADGAMLLDCRCLEDEETFLRQLDRLST